MYLVFVSFVFVCILGFLYCLMILDCMHCFLIPVSVIVIIFYYIHWYNSRWYCFCLLFVCWLCFCLLVLFLHVAFNIPFQLCVEIAVSYVSFTLFPALSILFCFDLIFILMFYILFDGFLSVFLCIGWEIQFFSAFHTSSTRCLLIVLFAHSLLIFFFLYSLIPSLFQYFYSFSLRCTFFGSVLCVQLSFSFMYERAFVYQSVVLYIFV